MSNLTRRSFVQTSTAAIGAALGSRLLGETAALKAAESPGYRSFVSRKALIIPRFGEVHDFERTTLASFGWMADRSSLPFDALLAMHDALCTAVDGSEPDYKKLTGSPWQSDATFDCKLLVNVWSVNADVRMTSVKSADALAYKALSAAGVSTALGEEWFERLQSALGRSAESIGAEVTTSLHTIRRLDRPGYPAWASSRAVLSAPESGSDTLASELPGLFARFETRYENDTHLVRVRRLQLVRNACQALRS